MTQGARKHTHALTAGNLPDAKLLSNFACVGNNTSATIHTAHISKINSEADLDPFDGAITFYNTGRWAPTNWFVFRELAHLGTVNLYPDKMVEWSNHGHDMEHPPSLLANLCSMFIGK